MLPQRTLNDITVGELADLEVGRPDLFTDPHRLAQHLDLAQSETPELIDMLETSRKLAATINRIVRPFRPG